MGLGKKSIEFTTGTSNIFQMGVDSKNCYEDFKGKYGRVPSGTCLLKEAKSYGEAKVNNAQFLSEYSCICWD